MLPLFDTATTKNKLMQLVAQGGLEQMGSLQVRWDKFEMMLESHQLMIKEQVNKSALVKGDSE